MLKATTFFLFENEQAEDLLSYNLIGVRHPEVYKTMFTRADNAALLPRVNEEAELPVLRKKHLLLQKLDNIQRGYFYAPTQSKAQFRDFIGQQDRQRYILKPDSGAGSVGISFLYKNGDTYELESSAENRQLTSLDDVYEHIKTKDMIVEEFIPQHVQLNDMFANCVNTICIHTVRLPSGQIEAVGMPYIQFGCGTSQYVNSGDVFVGIKSDGKLFSYGFQKRRGLLDVQRVTRHPDSGVSFQGFQIPYWPETMKLALDCAEKIPQLMYIKWDLAITPTGPEIIEGNGMSAGYSIGQTYSLAERHIGVKKELSEFYEALAFAKSMTQDRVKVINSTLADFRAGHRVEDCDTVIILTDGVNAANEIGTALGTLQPRTDARYILCGGDDSIRVDDEGSQPVGIEDVKRYLTKQCGVNEADVLVHKSAGNTEKNLLSLSNDLSKMGAHRIAIVSSWFHGRRVSDLLDNGDCLELPRAEVRFAPIYDPVVEPDNWTQSLQGIREIYGEWKNYEAASTV